MAKSWVVWTAHRHKSVSMTSWRDAQQQARVPMPAKQVDSRCRACLPAVWAPAPGLLAACCRPSYVLTSHAAVVWIKSSGRLCAAAAWIWLASCGCLRGTLRTLSNDILVCGPLDHSILRRATPSDAPQPPASSRPLWVACCVSPADLSRTAPGNCQVGLTRFSWPSCDIPPRGLTAAQDPSLRVFDLPCLSTRVWEDTALPPVPFA